MGYFDNGDVGIVTGSARGIGEATARRFAREGARLVLVDFDEEAGEKLLAELRRDGHEAIFVRADVSEARDVETVRDEALTAFGRIDTLVNCAGIAGKSAPIWEQTDEDWHRMLAVDLSSIFYFCRAVIPVMRERRYGRIVNVASIAGKEGNPNAVPYSAAKAGVIGLTKALAKEVARDGILVNSVTPAVIMTPILKQLSQEHIDYMLKRIPMGRPGEADEVAALIAWLSSRECSFSTGACYDISGGRATY